MQPDAIKRMMVEKKVEGYLSDEEGLLLYSLAKKVRKGVIVEIGSWKGKSTIWLGHGSRAGMNAKVYAIDPFDGGPEMGDGKTRVFPEFKRNIRSANLSKLVVPIPKTSEAAARTFAEPIALLFIDGVHEYSYVRQDFRLWFPKVIPGGVMAFHDTTLPGPKRVVEQLVFKSRHFQSVRFVDSITFAEKVSQNKVVDRIKNRYVLFLKRLRDSFGNLPVPGFARKVAKRVLRRAQ